MYQSLFLSISKWGKFCHLRFRRLSLIQDQQQQQQGVWCKLTCFKLEGDRTLGTQDHHHGMCGSGDTEAWSLGMTADSAVMRSSSDEIKTNMSHIWSQMTDGLCARISAVIIINIKYPPQEKVTLKTYVYFPYSNVNQISREAWKCWSCILIVYKRQKKVSWESASLSTLASHLRKIH